MTEQQLILSADRPLPLTGIDQAWRVDRGFVDLFVVRAVDGRPSGRREFLLRRQPGDILLGAAGLWPVADTLLLAVGGLDTALVPAGSRDVALEDWVAGINEAMRDPNQGWADRSAAIGPMSLAEGASLGALGRQVLWVAATEGEVMGPWGLVATPGSPAIPVSAAGPLRAAVSSCLQVFDTAALNDVEFRAATAGHFAALARYAVALLLFRQQERADRASRSAVASEEILATGLVRLTGKTAVDEGDILGAGDPVWRALSRVAAALSFSLPGKPPEVSPALPVAQRIAAHADQAELRLRPILLRDGWWRRDSGPVLAVRQDDDAPVALVRRVGRYELWDAKSSVGRPVDAALAETVAPEAWMLYRTYPATVISPAIMARFALSGMNDIWWRLAVLSLMSALLGMGVPVASGLLLDQVIPNSARDQVLMLGGGLIAAAIGIAGLGLTRGLVLQQMEGRFSIGTQAAMFDRLLRLPIGFFRRFGTGDLVDRVLAVEQIRRILTGATLTGMIAGLMSVLNLAVMLACNEKLALVGLASALLSGGIAAGFAVLQLRRERRLAQMRGQAESFVLQSISGVAKLKVAAALDRAFAIWARTYGRQRQAFVDSRRASNMQAIWPAGFVPLSMAALFLTAAVVLKDDTASAMVAAKMAAGTGQPAPDPSSFGLGAWIAFSSAYGQLMGGIAQTVGAVTGALNVIPLYERARPLLETLPETAGERQLPGTLAGGIEVSGLTFGYAEDMPPVLAGLNFAIRPGEYVGIVGPSGSGKSTILRLLLGFEQPTAGAVLFDGKPLDSLDITALRRQIGVVLQNGRVQPGSILSNIASGRQITAEEAWTAARLAGFAEDVQAMPMGLYTVMSDGGGTLSGGQRQRLMIARALAQQPRILLLDEATSALDNRTQALVTETLAGLGLTRIVVAHRLSTIAMVDRVLVIDRGRLVQNGSYQDLLNTPGLFQDLAHRQML